MTITTFELRDRFAADRGDIAIGGMHAIVRTIIDQRRADRRAGLRTAGLISGYPGSPVGGIDAVIGQQRAILDELDVRFVPGLNEELGATAVWGSQVANVIGTGKYDGVLGMWYGKAPGLDRASDAIREANWVGVGEFGGALAVVGDDPQNKSSALPSASELTLADLELPVVYPGSVAEVIALGRYAYELSRYCGAWSALKIVTEVADAYQTVSAIDERQFVRPEFTWRDAPWKPTQHITLQPVHTDPLEIEIRTGRIEAARRFADVNEIDRLVVDPAEASLLLVTPGRV